MSDVSQGPGWWLASDGKWYPPHTAPQAAVAPEHQSALSASQLHAGQGPGAAPGYGAPTGAWPGWPGGYGAGPGGYGAGPDSGGAGLGSIAPDAAQTPATAALPAHQSAAHRHWQPWLALVGVALVLWGAGQGLLAWSEWRLVQTEFSPYGTVAPGHLGMVLTAAGIAIAGLATVAVALTLDRH